MTVAAILSPQGEEKKKGRPAGNGVDVRRTIGTATSTLPSLWTRARTPTKPYQTISLDTTMRLEEGYVQFFFLSFDEHRHVILDVILKNVYSCQLILWLVKRIIVIRDSK